MPQQNEHLSFKSDDFVSAIDYSEARTILYLTTTKQKQLRREHSQKLYMQLLLKRTYTHVCEVLDSDCSMDTFVSVSLVDGNKRKLSSDNYEISIQNKKQKYLVENDILQFLRELNSVKVTPRY